MAGTVPLCTKVRAVAAVDGCDQGDAVDDLDAAHAKLTEEVGASISGIETWDMGEFGSHRIAILRDPDGTTLELIEESEPLGAPTPADFG